MKNKTAFSLLMIGICLFLSSTLLFQQYQKAEAKTKVYASENLSSRQYTVMGKNVTEKVTIGGIGDILIHDWVYEDAFRGGKYNFNPIFQNIKGLLEMPDIVTANQESILGGTELGVSNYPMFNSPHEVADAIKNAGVDIVSTANNHSLDKGERGILSESRYLDSIGIPHVGTFTDQKDRSRLRVISKNGIKLAFLSYTFGTNGIPVPLEKKYLVNIINRDSMKEEIHRARQEADVVIMSIHWGNEYQRYPTEQQKDLAHFLANEGVDVIFGSHPHVLQPMQWITAKDGRRVLAVYSLGNFISGQMRDYKDIGGLATVDITKHVSEKGQQIELSNPIFNPTYVSQQHLKNYRVVPLKQAGSYGLANAAAKDREIHKFMTQWLR